MSITYQILGKASGDNALLVHIDAGQSIEHLLFDCGEGCLGKVPVGIIQKIDHLFFSHLHMDHIGGFDSFFRCNYNRKHKPNRIWGPPETARIIQHRFQGFMWNLHEEMHASWIVTDLFPDHSKVYRYELQEAFSLTHEMETSFTLNSVFETDLYEIKAVTLKHQTASIAYIVKEKPHLNIDTEQMAALNILPGPWLKQLKNFRGGTDVLTVDGNSYSMEELRKRLLIETPGDSIAYLTDFLPDEITVKNLTEFLNGCHTVVCEAQYRNSDLELAKRNYHSTATISALIALKSEVKELVLFHLSERYNRNEYLDVLKEAQQIFPATRFPSEWKIS